MMNAATEFGEFQRELFDLVRKLLPADGVRFFIYVPWAQLKQEAGSDGRIDEMARQYSRRYWEHDPMHPSRFETQGTAVISNSLIMSDTRWRETVIYREFYRPNGFFHNCDVFFRQQGRIVAVLTLVRRRATRPFTSDEVQLLERVQPFIEYALGRTYMSKRVHDRSSLSREYGLTAREMDVVEIALTGVGNKVLARHLDISVPTVRTHLQRIFVKLGVRSHAELLSRLMRAME
jgi:DNA-binding CsgD family transcriptional regulator